MHAERDSGGTAWRVVAGAAMVAGLALVGVGYLNGAAGGDVSVPVPYPKRVGGLALAAGFALDGVASKRDDDARRAVSDFAMAGVFAAVLAVGGVVGFVLAVPFLAVSLVFGGALRRFRWLAWP